MYAVYAQIARYTRDCNPGWVECRLTDASGVEWMFEEKVTVVSADNLDSRTNYPQPGMIACQIVKPWRDDNGREIVTIDTEMPWGIESSDGNTSFDVARDQVTDM